MKISLDGDWTLCYGPQPARQDLALDDLPLPGWHTIPARVPGNVELDLLAAGELEDLVRGNGIYQLRRLEPLAWCYQRKFDVPVLDEGERLLLCFGGIDCIAAVYVNRRLAGRCRNMLVEQRFDVTELLLKDTENEIAVLISSSVLEARKHQFSPADFAAEGRWESLSLRKAAHSFGWDIMPRALSAGLWREVSLESRPPTHWRAVYWATLGVDAVARRASLMVDWDFQTERALVDGLRVRVSLSLAGRTLYSAERPVFETHGRLIADLADVQLWWPRGLGEPTLYDATIELVDEHGAVLDEQWCRVGIRTIELQRTEITTPDRPGEFLFLVNGHKVFIKGTNWVPLDALHSRDAAHLDDVLAMAVDLNCNMLRCWGGNVYEDHAFFDLCDENGILVWQDFSMGCAIYPQDDGFARQILEEAESVVAKLRNHASLALWAGNNENDDACAWARTGLDPNVADRISRVVLSEVVRRLDPLRAYLPSSPYRSPELMARGGEDKWKPEEHLWGPRNDFKGDYYTSSPAHFVSEIGYHGCPDRASLEAMMDPEHLWPPEGNDQWLTHCVRPHPGHELYNYRIPLMTRQIGVLFESIPDNLDEYILASQASQAEALKFFIERWRMGKWRRTGMLWWNLRDGWPIISDAVVDYYNRRKLAYEFVRRSQTDVCVMCGEPAAGQHEVIAVNDTRKMVRGRARLGPIGGPTLLEEAFEIEANGRALVGSVPQSTMPAMWLIEYEVNGARLRNHYLAGPRPFRLADYRQWLTELRKPG